MPFPSDEFVQVSLERRWFLNSPRPVNATHCSVRRHRSWSSWDAQWEGVKGRREREGEEERRRGRGREERKREREEGEEERKEMSEGKRGAGDPCRSNVSHHWYTGRSDPCCRRSTTGVQLTHTVDITVEGGMDC